MPGTDMPQHSTVVRQILQQARALLVACESEEAPPLTELLGRAADRLSAEERAHLDPTTLAWAAAEAAVQLLVRTHIPVKPGDPNLRYCLQALDRLPLTARVGLLDAAIRYTAPEADHTEQPVPHVSAPCGPRPSRGRSAGRCPCPCNGGGFCGGCGHAGCGGR